MIKHHHNEDFEIISSHILTVLNIFYIKFKEMLLKKCSYTSQFINIVGFDCIGDMR